jgi:hypothetical protein
MLSLGLTMRKFFFLESAFTSLLPQRFVGLFFLAAAHHKLIQGFFGEHPVPLASVFQYWITNQLPLSFMTLFLKWTMPYADVLGMMVIAIQTVAGLSLLFNYHIRLTLIPLFLVQLTIVLATFRHPELRVLGFQTLWLLLFFFYRDHLTKALWHVATLLVCTIALLHLYVRYTVGDPWLSAVPWQYQHFKDHVMGSFVFLKFFVLWMMRTPFGPILWAGSWWLKLSLALGLCTRYRLLCGTLLLVYLYGVELVWMNAWNCEGAMWVLFLFTWMVREYEEERGMFSKT